MLLRLMDRLVGGSCRMPCKLVECNGRSSACDGVGAGVNVVRSGGRPEAPVDSG